MLLMYAFMSTLYCECVGSWVTVTLLTGYCDQFIWRVLFFGRYEEICVQIVLLLLQTLWQIWGPKWPQAQTTLEKTLNPPPCWWLCSTLSVALCSTWWWKFSRWTSTFMFMWMETAPAAVLPSLTTAARSSCRDTPPIRSIGGVASPSASLHTGYVENYFWSLPS